MPKREKENEELILELLDRDDIFIDVGSNIGYYTILAAKIVGPRGHVISLEPVPETANILRLNIKLNELKNVTIIQKAAWASRSLINVHIPRGSFGFASIKRFSGYPSIITDAVPLDDICNGLSRIKLIKIDVEGAEWEVLQGAIDTLKKTSALLIEATENVLSVETLLRNNSFSLCKLKTGDILAAKSQV